MWNGKASESERNADTSDMLKKDADIRFNVIAGGSHMYTWSLAYNYEGIRDWLFSQSK
jgi:predicted peptidase